MLSITNLTHLKNGVRQKDPNKLKTCESFDNFTKQLSKGLYKDGYDRKFFTNTNEPLAVLCLRRARFL